MKLSEIIKITKPDFLPVKIFTKEDFPECECGHDPYACYDCKNFNSSEENESICEWFYIAKRSVTQFEGDCKDVPLRLADCKVKEISVDYREVKKRKSSHDQMQLVIEIKDREAQA